MQPNPKLDTNRAWQSAHAAIKGNREALLAIAGVFFFLPALAFILLYPPPPAPPAAMNPEQAWTFFQTYYRESLPFTLAMSAAQLVGAMTILRLFAGRPRATVGDAMAKGALDAAVFLAATFVVSLGASIAIVLVLGLAAATGQQVIAGIAVAAAAIAGIYLFIRLILVMPVMAAEGARNPIVAFPRSWRLTRGNAGRILLFIAVLTLAYLVVSMVLSAILGIVLSFALGAAGAKIAVGTASSALGAVFTLYLFMSLAAIHSQLARPSPADLGDTFY